MNQQIRLDPRSPTLLGAEQPKSQNVDPSNRLTPTYSDSLSSAGGQSKDKDIDILESAIAVFEEVRDFFLGSLVRLFYFNMSLTEASKYGITWLRAHMYWNKPTDEEIRLICIDGLTKKDSRCTIFFQEKNQLPCCDPSTDKTFLHWAIAQSSATEEGEFYSKLAQDLMKAGADVNTTTTCAEYKGIEKPVSSLDIACGLDKPNIYIIKSLLDRNAQPTFRAIASLIQKSDAKIVQLLVEKCTDADILNQALDCACKQKNPNTDIINALLKKDAQPKASAIASLIQNKFFEIAVSLIEMSDQNTVNWSDSENMSLLHFASSAGNTETILALLKNGAKTSLGKPNKFGKTPLHIAKDQEIALLLIEQGAKNLPDTDGNTPLMIAIQKEFPKMIDKLIENKENIDLKALNLAIKHKYDRAILKLIPEINYENLTDSDKKDLLCNAYENNRLNALDKLLEKINPTNELLVLAINRDDLSLIKKIVPRVPDANHIDLANLAIRRKQYEVAADLFQISSLPMSKKLEALEKLKDEDYCKTAEAWIKLSTSPSEILKSVVKKGFVEVLKNTDSNKLSHARVEATDTVNNTRDEWTLMHLAAAYGHLDVMNALANKSFDLKKFLYQESSENRSTPLHLAARYNKMDIVLDLISKYKLAQIDNPSDPTLNQFTLINAKDSQGQTALHNAVLNGNYDMCVQLMNAGADSTLTDTAGKSPLALARELKSKYQSEFYVKIIKFMEN